MKVVEEAENGSVTGPHLMGLADKIASKEMTADAAIADARGYMLKSVA